MFTNTGKIKHSQNEIKFTENDNSNNLILNEKK